MSNTGSHIGPLLIFTALQVIACSHGSRVAALQIAATQNSYLTRLNRRQTYEAEKGGAFAVFFP